jgi:hypothetical protein
MEDRGKSGVPLAATASFGVELDADELAAEAAAAAVVAVAAASGAALAAAPQAPEHQSALDAAPEPPDLHKHPILQQCARSGRRPPSGRAA